jgi:hypothetical protein
MVLKESRFHLQSLSQLSPQLNEATDRYMVELKTIEAELQAMNLGIPVELSPSFWKSIEFEDVEDESETNTVEMYWFLAYGRIDASHWGFIVRKKKVQLENWGQEYVLCEEKPLLKVSRDIRIQAAEKIPALLHALEEQVKEKIETINKVSDR